MGGGEDEVAATVDVLCFADSKASPKHEDDACALLCQSLYGGIGEEFPSAMLVRACLVGAYGECGVEKQYTLVGPACEIATGEGNIGAKVVVDFLDNVDQ